MAFTSGALGLGSSLFALAGRSSFALPGQQVLSIGARFAEGQLTTAAIVSVVIFILLFVAISFHLLHETAAALLGAVVVFLITYVGGHFDPGLQILGFDAAMDFVDWNVIFLILGMMIFMAVLAETNVFKWLAFRIYLASKGNVWLLVVALVSMTGFISAFLNNVTAIILIVPLSIQIATAIGLSPLAIVIPEIMASNIGGAATLIGDPPSTIVGSHIGISFTDYMVNVAPIALICMAALLGLSRYMYRKEYSSDARTMAPSLLEKMAQESQIGDRKTLSKALVVGAVTFVLFFVADAFDQMPPSVVALSGAALLIAWIRPDIQRMMREVDWTTLIFFIGLFVVVGGMEATGAIAWLATRIQILAGESVAKAVVLINWVSGFASGVVANIPYTVAALPIADLLNQGLPAAAQSRVLYFALILGADLGGNLTYLGSASNIVAVGLLWQAGYRLSFGRFLRDGAPVTLTTLLLATVWLLLRY